MGKIVCTISSQIAQPPVLPALLHFHEPAAREVQNDKHSQPHQVDERQPVSVAVGDIVPHKCAVQQPLHGLMEQHSHEHREQVNRVEVQDVVEHRYPSEDEQRLEHTRGVLTIEKRQQQNAGTQGHQQELQRWRILLNIEEKD